MGDFDIGISCFALSYLGCGFLLKEFYSLLGDKGQIGLTTSSVNSLPEWHSVFLEPLSQFASEANLLEEMPANAADLKTRMEEVGFRNVEVVSKNIPLRFKDSREAASFLISSGWLSGYFFRLQDKELRRNLLEWALNVIEEHRNGSEIMTSIEFLIAWNHP